MMMISTRFRFPSQLHVNPPRKKRRARKSERP
jgi:hypothetical protein